MKKNNKVSDFTFVMIFVLAIAFSALLISTSDQKQSLCLRNLMLA